MSEALAVMERGARRPGEGFRVGLIALCLGLNRLQLCRVLDSYTFI